MTKKIKKNALILAILTFGLFSIKLTASDFNVIFKDAQPATFKTMCVFFDMQDQKQRSKFEQAMVLCISRYSHVSGYSGMQMFPPAKLWEPAKIHDRLNNMNIDGVIKITYGKDSTNPNSTHNTFKATAIRNKDNLTVWIGTVEVPLDKLTPVRWTHSSGTIPIALQLLFLTRDIFTTANAVKDIKTL